MLTPGQKSCCPGTHFGRFFYPSFSAITLSQSKRIWFSRFSFIFRSSSRIFPLLDWIVSVHVLVLAMRVRLLNGLPHPKAMRQLAAACGAILHGEIRTASGNEVPIDALSAIDLFLTRTGCRQRAIPQSSTAELAGDSIFSTSRFGGRTSGRNEANNPRSGRNAHTW